MNEHPRKFLPTLPRFEPETMDHTATKEFKKCPRSYFYRMNLGRTSPEGKWASVFAWGSAIHKYLERLYEDGDAGAAAQAALPIYKSPTNPTFEWQTKERLLSTFARLYKMYLEEKSNNVIRVEAIEQPFNITIPRWNSRWWKIRSGNEVEWKDVDSRLEDYI